MSSLESASIDLHDYAKDACRIARHVHDHGKLPASLAPYEVANSWRFALGAVPEKIRGLFQLGQMASYSDLGRAVERRLNPPKQGLEPVYIGDRPPSLRELRLERLERGAEPDADSFSPAPAIHKPETDAKTARDWRAAIQGN